MADKLSARGWHEKNCVKYWDFDPLSDGIVRNIHRLEEDYAKYFAAELEAENKRLHHELIETTDSRAALFTERRKLEARLTAALEVLKAVEWRLLIGDYGYPTCPKCKQAKKNGHASDCTLDAVLNPKEKA